MSENTEFDLDTLLDNTATAPIDIPKSIEEVPEQVAKTISDIILHGILV